METPQSTVSQTPLILLDNVVKTFHGGVQALRGVSMQVEKGSVFGIIGRSGAGKSTLIRVLNALEKPTSGRVLIGGVDINTLGSDDLKALRRRIGMIFQHFNLVKTLNVHENVLLPLKLHKVPQAEAKKRADEFLELVGLSDKAKAFPAQLSGGQKQRVAIARTLALQPEILLSDEATSALDPETKDSILDLLRQINRDLSITIVLITHELSVVQKICRQGAVMDAGLIVEQGEVFDLFNNPQAALTQSFLNSHFHETVLPKVLEAASAPGKFIRVAYSGPAAVKPALALMAKEFAVVPNILSGIITELNDGPYGRMTVHLEGKDAEVSAAIDFLRSEGVGVTEVPRDELTRIYS